MEIRSEIIGHDGNLITIIAGDPTEFNHAYNILARRAETKSSTPKIDEFVKPTRKHSRLTMAQLHNMKSMKRNGLSAVKISSELGIPYKTVWAQTKDIKPKVKKSTIERLTEIRARHNMKTPIYHIDCPACLPLCGATLEDYLQRSKDARTKRLIEYKQSHTSPKRA